MVFHYTGRYRTVCECKFLEQAEDELTEFWNTCHPNSILVFPPLTARYRFLIHQLFGVDSRLQTVSIGQGKQRRTVVYLAEGREQCKMADSPSAAQRTFFGRGRGRRTRRPDQERYVPGALRRAKLEQQEQGLSRGSPVNKGAEKDFYRIKSSDEHDGLTSAISGSAQNNGSDTATSYKSCERNSEPKAVDSSYNSATPEFVRAVDVLDRTGSAPSDAHEQLGDIQSRVSDNQRVMKDNKEASSVLIRAQRDTDNAVAVDSSMVLEADVPNSLEVRGKTDERNTKGTVNDAESFERESSNSIADVGKNTLEARNTENSQTCTSTLSDYNVTGNVLRAVNENSGDFYDKSVPRVEEGVVTSSAKHVSAMPGQESVLQMAGTKTIAEEVESKVAGGGDNKCKGGLAEISAVVCRDWGREEKVVGQDECGTEKDIMIKDGEVLRTCGAGSDDTDCKEEQGGNKEIMHGNMFQSVSSAWVTLESTGSSYDTKLPLSQPSSCNAGKGFHPGFGNLSTSEDNVPNQLTYSDGCVVNSDSTGCQSKTNMEQLINKAPQVTSMQSSEDAPGNSGSGVDLISDVPLSTCLVNNGKSKSHNYSIGLSSNSNENIKEPAHELGKMNEQIQGLSDRTVRSSESVVVEANKNGDELQREQSKTSSGRKKKTKKEKSKEGEDKVKSKEKGEKKKKREKKSVKTEKCDKEQTVDSEAKIKEERKSKTKGLSTKEEKKKDSKKCDDDNFINEELSADAKGAVASCSNHDCAGSDGDDDDDDNWESNFDESGDCLKPEHLEELSRLTGITNPEVRKTQYDYYSFTPKGDELEVDNEEFGHIVEIYDFSPELKTEDIMQALSSFRSKGFDMKWVDDTHALGVFSSRISAQDAIRMCSTPLMKLRPISQGTPESRKKATNCFEFLQPYRERPQTSKLLADRLVTGALGMRSKMTREERVKEREKLKEAKNKKQQEKIEKAKIWED